MWALDGALRRLWRKGGWEGKRKMTQLQGKVGASMRTRQTRETGERAGGALTLAREENDEVLSTVSYQAGEVV